MSRRSVALALAFTVVGALTVTACGSSTSGTGGSPGKLRVVASFYPLQWMAQQVAGDHAAVTSLTKAGAEPHDLELVPQDIVRVGEADLVVYLKGFQPAVDQTVSQEAGDHAYDVSAAADLSLHYTPIEAGQQHAEQSGAVDPHFWLDPTRLANVSRQLARRFASLDPSHAQDYAANATALEAKLSALDHELSTGLAGCTHKDLVTSHNAFGYLAQRYGLTQVGITGLTPEDEPKPSDLGRVADFVKQHEVRTIYYETLVSPAIADTVASETGARTAVLDPIEGLTDRSRGRDYLAVMRSNLASLQKGQPCP
ncbi:MAG: metal ABC transporter substrate-binding protein [Actinomycetes bacterium]